MKFPRINRPDPEIEEVMADARNAVAEHRAVNLRVDTIFDEAAKAEKTIVDFRAARGNHAGSLI